MSAGSLLARIDRTDLVRIAVVAACALATALLPAWPLERVPLIALVGLMVGLWPILREAFGDVRARRMSMELSMLLAIAAAAAIGEWVTALIIAAFVLAAEILEDLSMDRGREALTDLMSFLPESVQVRRTGAAEKDGSADGTAARPGGGAGTVVDAPADFRDVPLAEVRVGDTVLVPPGGRVPVDGAVIAGASAVDASRVTGESLPVDVGPGDGVHAGSVNQMGALEVRAERVGEDSSYGRIVRAVREAQSTEAPAQRLADRLAAWLVYIALAGAAVTFLLTRDLTATISVILVAGACGIAAGTPLAVLAAIARTARTGAFVKGGAQLEALSAVDTVVFDKTGTLTTGDLQVVSVRPADGMSVARLLRLAGSAELYSEHPTGRVLVRRAREMGIPLEAPTDFAALPGRGIRARVAGALVEIGGSGDSRIQVRTDGARIGSVRLADTVRPGSAGAISALRARGLRVLMLTGDAPATAHAIGRELGIEDVEAGLLPEQKLARIDAEIAAGHRLAMVGDGVNDAPALLRADVGIAMGSGTDVAQESAGVVLISSDPEDLARTLLIARRARRIVTANFAGTIAVDLLGIVLAAVGMLNPLAAALVHVGSETAFILNSARLIPGRRTGVGSSGTSSEHRPVGSLVR
ncbi:cadmium-translocating P-type ATPase [Brachybacterium halotolerans subsp. kimchii]|uniref:heavy metal translocating P-type ATPase n=1 Tax=Brachybacterium halotolerans TaxID=2795215 RepID=UPI001E2B42E4|nr:cation-translocating P-type ATPase [Brachybacterium halotolerans]UEJ81958.1 cadmium-translocating P-type ATPase [Brachybacterium halotolerans subsp. kimchii]